MNQVRHEKEMKRESDSTIFITAFTQSSLFMEVYELKNGA